MARVSTDPSNSYIVGRNGYFPIKEIGISTVYNGASARIVGIGVSGREINGGLFTDADQAIEVCKKFLEENGFKVSRDIKFGEDHYETVRRVEEALNDQFEIYEWKTMCRDLDVDLTHEEITWAETHTEPVVRIK